MKHFFKFALVCLIIFVGVLKTPFANDTLKGRLLEFWNLNVLAHWNIGIFVSGDIKISDFKNF